MAVSFAARAEGIDGGRRHRAPLPACRLTTRARASRASAPRLRQAAESLSQRLPALLVEAERVAATVAPGVHGRRRTGMGETFWQFRQYQPGDAADCDRLAPVGALAPPVRARAGMGGGRERLAVVRPVAIHGVPLRRPSCRSSGSARALLLLALAALLVRGGERVALLGGGERPATGGRYGMETLIRCLARAAAERAGEAPLPPAAAPCAARAAVATSCCRSSGCASGWASSGPWARAPA